MSGYIFPRPMPKGEWPLDDAVRIIAEHSGLTKRELFAMVSLYAIRSHDSLPLTASPHVASFAVSDADALLHELARVR